MSTTTRQTAQDTSRQKPARQSVKADSRITSNSRRQTLHDLVQPTGKDHQPYVSSVRANQGWKKETNIYSMPKGRPLFSLDRLKRHGRAKMYRLKGYIKLEGAYQIYQEEVRRTKRIKRMITGVVLVIFLILLLLIKPFPFLAEFYRAVGL